MYIFKNALTSIARNKGRNLLIGIIILVISCATAVTLAINNSSENLINSYAEKYEVEATLSMNREKMMGNFDPSNRESFKEDMHEKFSQASSLSVSDVEKYGDSDYVNNYYYTISVGVNAEDLEKAEISMPDNGMGGGKDRPEDSSESSTDFTLVGYSSLSGMSKFIDGTYTITDGQVFEDFSGTECIINSELATLNEISVGDTLTIVDPDNEKSTYALTVIGIFSDNDTPDAGNGGGFQMFTDSANNIITNASFVSKLGENNSDLSLSVTPTFVLTSSDVVEAFSSELTEKGLDENLTVETNLDKISEATKSISNVRTFAITFLIITLIIGTVVLLIINMINVRERRYEIGVLRTIGMKKSKVTLQFLYELLIVSIASLFVGAGIGAALSVPVSNGLLSNEIESSKTATEQANQNFGFGGRGSNAPSGGSPVIVRTAPYF